MDIVKAYIALTKPRVIELLLVATIPAMLQADRGNFHAGLVFLTVIGGWMGAAAANTFNMIIDTDIDKVMRRTEKRPLVAEKHQISNRNALVFAWILTVASFLILTFIAHSLTAAIIVMATIIWYVYVYTKWLKRSTSQNVIWGGVAGCTPAVVGFAVIVDNTGASWTTYWQAIVLFLVVFFWTPPHTWALAMKYRDDYEAAGVPMLPVVASAQKTTQMILIYTIATVAVTLALIPATGWVYLVVTVLAGIVFIVRSAQMHGKVKKGEDPQPMKLFMLANMYLAVWCLGLAIDAGFNIPGIV